MHYVCQKCELERRQQKWLSPCVVGDDETILYVILDPRQIQNGALTPTAFSKDDLKKRNLSVCRADYSSADQVFRSIVAPSVKKGQNFVGVVSAKCKDIRAMRTAQYRQQICVIDDGIPNNIAHATLGYHCAIERAKNGAPDANARIAARANLLRLFNLSPTTTLTLSTLFCNVTPKRSPLLRKLVSPFLYRAAQLKPLLLKLFDISAARHKK